QRLSAEGVVSDDVKRKLEEKRREQANRTEEYRQELEAMNRRLLSRALVLEQQEMLIEKQRFQKKYEESMAKVRSGIKKVTFKDSSSARATSNNVQELASSRSSTASGSSRKSLKHENGNSKSDEGTTVTVDGGGTYSSFETYSGDEADSSDDSSKSSTPSDDKLSKISEEKTATTSRSSVSRSSSSSTASSKSRSNS
ncbi:unnamed protein product, partial [Anisakis simplex]|uniref:THOC7 protein n=1 Tax=Anisakis simplex TaxID=6269 RepID=A0A0M3K5F6_ANISI